MTDDIMEWLRTVAPDARAFDPQSRDDFAWPLKNGLFAAADEIERLRAENKTLRVNNDTLKTVIQFMENGDEVYRLD